MTPAEVSEHIEALGLVPVVRSHSAQHATLAVEALVSCGVTVVEITLTVPDADVVIREVRARFRDAAVIGAGTVTSAAEVEASLAAGAQFIVSPGFAADVVAAARAHDVLAISGALTPTEIMAATRAGADWIKIFPCAAVGGPSYLRSLRGPFPRLKLLPTGGVHAANVADYIKAGAAAVGVGSELVDPTELAAGQTANLRERARTFRSAIASARAAP